MVSLTTRGLGRAKNQFSKAFIVTAGLGIGALYQPPVPEVEAIAPQFLQEAPLAFPYDNFYEYSSTSTVAILNETFSEFLTADVTIPPEVAERAEIVSPQELKEASAHVYAHSVESSIGLESNPYYVHLSADLVRRYAEDEQLLTGIYDETVAERIKVQSRPNDFKLDTCSDFMVECETVTKTNAFRPRIAEEDELIFLDIV